MKDAPLANGGDEHLANGASTHITNGGGLSHANGNHLSSENMEATHVDALIVGAGFGGIYQLYTLRKIGLKCKLVDRAMDVGGTWNRFPGAMSDVDSYLYRYSFDKELLASYPLKERYIKQQETVTYLRLVVDKYDLRKDMQFNVEVSEATCDKKAGIWRVPLSTGEHITCRHLVTAVGILTKPYVPNFKGIETFKGELYHTGRWPDGVNLKGKNVAVIGNGSTGIQVVPTIAKEVKSLTCFQRSASYSVPAGDGPLTEDYQKWVRENYEDIWDRARNSFTGTEWPEPKVATMEVSAEEREKVFQDAWEKGNGIRFMFGTFWDITLDKTANAAAGDFIKAKIHKIVKDPEKARKLTPTDYYAKRPLCDSGYYDAFNRDNVDIVSLKETPVETFTPNGIRTSDGNERELDVIILATGFDGAEGSYSPLTIRGENQQLLNDRWKEKHPTSYLGVSVPNFPNLWLMGGPQSPFTNYPLFIETQGEFIADVIKQDLEGGVFEVTQQAEDEWTELALKMGGASLFSQIEHSWLYGSNIPGKMRGSRFAPCGLKGYREVLAKERANGYPAYKKTKAAEHSRV